MMHLASAGHRTMTGRRFAAFLPTARRIERAVCFATRRAVLALPFVLPCGLAAAQPYPAAGLPWARITPDMPDYVVGRCVQLISGDQRWIVFSEATGSSEFFTIRLWRVRTDGTVLQQISFDEYDWGNACCDHLNPRISHDGSRLVYRMVPDWYSAPNWKGDVVFVDIDAGTFRRLTDFAVQGNHGGAGPVEISGDGSTVVYTAAVPGDYAALYLWKVGWPEPKRILENFVSYSMRMSADGSLLAFVRIMKKPPYPHELFVLPLDRPAKPKRITFLGGWVENFTMDAKGEWIAFQWRTEDIHPMLMRIRTDGTGLETLFVSGKNNGIAYIPSISGDGSTLLFFYNPSGQYDSWQIARMDLQTGAIDLLTDPMVGCEFSTCNIAAPSYDTTFVAANPGCVPYEGNGYHLGQVYVLDTRLPHLVVAGPLQIGKTSRFTLTGPPDAGAFLFVSAGKAASTMPGVGTFLLDPKTCHLLAFDRFDAYGTMRLDVTVPAQVSSHGPFYFQGVSTQPPGFSNLLEMTILP